MLEFYLSCIGITILITQSSILEKFRNLFARMGDFFEELINCPMCTGFWVGVFMSLLFNNNVIFSAATSSLLSWLVYVAANFLYSVTIYIQNKTIDEEIDEN
jgi:hypothetical protein